MLRKLSVLLGMLVCFLFLFARPIQCALWVKNAYQSFTERLLPSLFLPMVFSGFLFRSPLQKPLGRFLAPVLRPLFGVNAEEALALFFGFFCGYPTGIVMLKTLREQNKISLERFQALTLFSNNCGLGFLFSYISSLFSPRIACCLFLAQLVSSLFLCRMALGFCAPPPSPPASKDAQTGYGKAFLDALRQTLLSLAAIGGFLIVFEFLSQMACSLLEGASPFLSLAVSGVLELCGACLAVSQQGLPPFLCALAIGWGGLCVWLQSRMAAEGLPLHPRYLFFKGINALLCGVFYLLFSQILL